MTRFLSLGLFLLPVSAFAADWEAVTADLIKAEKPGYGNLCGVAVDHSSGDVFINLSDKCLYRSTDQGTTWKKHGPVIKGRTNGGCFLFDPTGKARWRLALVYVTPIGLTADLGERVATRWQIVARRLGRHQLEPRREVHPCSQHEARTNDRLARWASRSGSRKATRSAWIFDIKTAVVAGRNQIAQSLRALDDGGKRSPVGEFAATTAQYHDGTLYWRRAIHFSRRRIKARAGNSPT